jgi:hypothetical protein
MADSPRHDASQARTTGAPGGPGGSDEGLGAGRDARIEELLLAGLDHYFAAQYDEAINVWTRVLFLDRGHARARAYIERARGAVAERHRESEELLHRGVAAFNDGDTGAARSLLTRAVERGASDAEALAVLGRLDRLDARLDPTQTPSPSRDRRQPPVADALAAATAGSSTARRVLAALGTVVLLGAIVGGGLMLSGVLEMSDLSFATPTRSAERPGVARDPLPVPPAAEISITRARTLYEKGRLREALRTLDAIGTGDPLAADALALRALIHRALLSTAGGRGLPVPDR